MGDATRNSGETLEKLHQEIAVLKRRIETLESRLDGGPVYPMESQKSIPGEDPGGTLYPGSWSEGAMADIMSRGAAVSLILLVALVLRLLTDGGVMAAGFGTFLGITYALLLEGAGLLLYRSDNSFAPVFSVSGILLLVAVILEAHAGFNAVSTAVAYALLATAAGVLAIISHLYRVTLPVCVGITVVLLVGVPLDFPEPDFAALAVFLAAVNVMVFTGSHLPRCRWLRMLVLGFTSAILLLWSVKLSASLKTGTPLPADKALFLVITAAYFVFYTGVSVFTIWKSDHDHRDIFMNLLPTSAALLTYLTSLMVVLASGAGQHVLGMGGVGAATFLLAVAALRSRGPLIPPRGINTFAFPAALLLALSFRDLSGRSVVALAILSWAALSLAWLSTRWSSEGVRVTSYFLQALVLGASSLLLLRAPSGELSAAVTLSMAFIGVVAFTHYVLVRRNPPSGHTAYFSEFDRKDLSGVAPLIVSAGAFFLALRSVFFVFLGGGEQSFRAAETVLATGGAIVLFTAAWMKKNTEIKWVAVLITVLAGGKVFLYDLFRVEGMSVVVSVLFFGLAATLGSLVLGKWQNVKASEGDYHPS